MILFFSAGCLSLSGCRISSDGKPAKFQPPPKPVIIDKQKQREERRWVPGLVLLTRGLCSGLPTGKRSKSRLETRLGLG